MIKALVGQLVQCAANRLVARPEGIKKAPTGSGKYRSSAPASTTDSLNRLLSNGQERRWRGRAGNEFTVVMYPKALFCFQTE